MATFFSPGYKHDSRNWYNSGSWQELFLVGGAYRLGIFATFETGPNSAETIAEKIGGDPRAVNLLLDALEQAGYLLLSEAQYVATPKTVDTLVDRKHPDFIGFALSHSMRLAERWLTLPKVVKTGTPVSGDRFSETVEGFVMAMDVYARSTAGQVVDLCLKRSLVAGSARVLDIGGASGTVSRVFAGRAAEVTLFDIPEVVELMTDELGGEPRITLIGGDFNERLPDGPFDIVFLGNVTHIYGPEKNAALLKRVAAVLSPGGLVAILDFVRGVSPSAPFFGINMLVNTTDGGTWTAEEYTKWLTDAGFSDIEILDVEERDQQLVLGRKC